VPVKVFARGDFGRATTYPTADAQVGLAAVRPKRNTSKPHPEHKICPYLLRDKTISTESGVVGGHHLHSDASGIVVAIIDCQPSPEPVGSPQ
jgi:hypothetical protein